VKKGKYYIETFQDKNKDWGWCIKARNGQVLNSSTRQGYKRKATMMRIINSLLAYAYECECGLAIVERTSK